MWSLGSICHPVIIPSILKPLPAAETETTLKKKLKKNTKENGWGYWQRNVQRAGAASSSDPRWDAAEQSFCFSVYMREIDLSGLASAVSTNIKSIFWLWLNVPNSTTNISQRQKKWRQTTFLCAFLTHQTYLCIYFRFQTLLWWQETFWGVVSASSQSIDRATVNRKSQHRHGFITVSSTPQSGKGKSIHWFIFTLQNVLFFSGTEI